MWAEEPTIKDGFLRKSPPQGTLTTLFKSQRTRYFRLTGDSKFTYARDAKSRAIGEIDLACVREIEQRQFAFIIRTDFRDWILSSVATNSADQERDIQSWVTALTAYSSPEPTSVDAPQPRGPSSSLPSNTASDGTAVARKRGSESFGDGSFLIGNHIKTYVRKKVSQKKYRFQRDGFDLDLCYITRRIIAMGFPSQGMEGMYRNPLDNVQRFFQTYHADHYKLYNLCSERNYDAELFEGRVECFPFDDHQPPKLSLVVAFCESLKKFLDEDPENTAAIHCKAGKGRTGTMICCYLLFSGQEPNAEAALKFYGVMRTSNGQGVTIPSQRRYVHYFDTQLKMGFQQPRTLRVLRIKLVTIPHFDKITGGCDPFFKVYSDKTKIYDTRDHESLIKPARKKSGEHVIDVTGHDLIICGDLKFIFLDLDVLSQAERMFSFWINTGHTKSGVLKLERSELDGACNDRKGHFDPHFRLEIELKELDKSDSVLRTRSVPLRNSLEDINESASEDEQDLEAEDEEEMESIRESVEMLPPLVETST